jgi:hypothetical protein
MAVEAEVETIETVCDELLAAIRQHKPKFRPQKETESDAEYIERVLQAIADIPDEIYNKLSPEALQWFAQAAETTNAGEQAEPPDGFVSAFKPKKEPTPKKLITREKPVKETPPTMGALIRRAIIDNRDISVQDLETMLAAAGFTDIKRTTVFSFQRGSLDTLKVAEQMGRFSWPT